MSDNPETPKVRRCGSMEVYHRQLETFPQLRQRQFALHAATSRRMAALEAARTGVTRIPVVVHVVYNNATDTEVAVWNFTQLVTL